MLKQADDGSRSALRSGYNEDPRFWQKVRLEGRCLVYVGSRDRQGYGRVLRKAISRSPLQAHRYSWMLANGPIPDGGVIRHSCDNPPCVYPFHLTLGTQADNIADRQRRGRHRPGRLLGVAHPAHKLTEADVMALRTRRAEGESIVRLAVAYEISYGTAWQIIHGRLWGHLPLVASAA